MAIALLGGTFDPVHCGHIEIGTQLADYLDVEHVRLMPCGIPAHREPPTANPQQRLEMLGLAIAKRTKLTIERCEIAHTKPSYSIDTLRQIRADIGPVTRLFMCLGMDALEHLHHWHEWRQLLDYCHILVVSRPGTEYPVALPLKAWIKDHQSDRSVTDELRPAGCLYFCTLSLLDISSTQIRQHLKQHRSIEHLTPDAVIDYIHRHNIYE